MSFLISRKEKFQSGSKIHNPKPEPGFKPGFKPGSNLGSGSKLNTARTVCTTRKTPPV